PEGPPIRSDESTVVSSISLSSIVSELTALILFVLTFFGAFVPNLFVPTFFTAFALILFGLTFFTAFALILFALTFFPVFVLILLVPTFFTAFFGAFFDTTNFRSTDLLFTAGFFLPPALLISVPLFVGLSFEFFFFFLIFLEVMSEVYHRHTRHETRRRL